MFYAAALPKSSRVKLDLHYCGVLVTTTWGTVEPFKRWEEVGEEPTYFKYAQNCSS